jgi:hypothetical protein
MGADNSELVLCDKAEPCWRKQAFKRQEKFAEETEENEASHAFQVIIEQFEFK